MLKSQYLECVNYDTNTFSDNNLLYKIVPAETVQEEIQDSSGDSSSEYLHEKTSELSFNDVSSCNTMASNDYKKQTDLSDVSPSKIVPDDTIKAVEEVSLLGGDALPSVDWNTVDSSHLSKHQCEALENLRCTFANHCSNYLRQILNSESVPQSWVEVIRPLACRVVKNIRPERAKTWSEAMDIRQYVHIKKVSGGERRECEIIQGLVCSKNLTHRAMPKKMVDPQILLLGSAIMYQRVEGKYLSLEPAIMQEHDYLQRAVSKIVDLGPNLVIVGKSVTRLAQEMLYSKGISLVINAKPALLERLSRFTGADILGSVDAHLGSPRLGTCKLFCLRTFMTESKRQKTLMVFEGCPYPELGCTVLLRGGLIQELTKVKKAIASLIFAYYNARLEVSYHMDAGAVVPSTQNVFLDSLEQNLLSEDCFDVKSKTKQHNSHQTEERHRTEAVSDFSDPLRAWKGNCANTNDELSVTEVPFGNSFRKALEDNILSISPFLKFSLPYLESEEGKQSVLRSFFSKELYWSAQLTDNLPKQRLNLSSDCTGNIMENVKLKDVHEFVKAKLIESVDSNEIKALLASYRATGGRFPIKMTKPTKMEAYYDQLVINNINASKNIKDGTPKDVLDPDNHQRLLMLFCSYTQNRSSPTFCVDPEIVNMEMYGRMDIPLGLFLEKYCFRDDYVCSHCDNPIKFHTRRFVHNGGVININLYTLDQELPLSGIFMWSSCSKCGQTTSLKSMSPGSRCLSFAKYLEMRFHGDMYHLNNSECRHSLYQDHVHHFTKGSILASFMYSKITIWEISLPPKELKMDIESYNELVKLEEIKAWWLMGTQILSLCLDKIYSFNLSDSQTSSLLVQLQRDQSLLKSRVEESQTKRSTEEENPLSLKSVWSDEDSLVAIKRQLAEFVEDWNVRLAEAETSSKKEDKRKSIEAKPSPNPLSELVIEGEKEVENIMETSDLTIGEEINENEDIRSVDATETESAPETDDDAGGYHVALTETKSVHTDKKSVKQIFSQFLPNSNQNIHLQMPANNLEHYLLPVGVYVPLVVYEKEHSSIIAYALNSHSYKQALEKLRNSEQSMSSPSNKRKSGSEFTKEEGSLGEKRSVLSYLRSSSSGPMDKGTSKIEGVQYNPNLDGSLEEEATKVEDKNKPTKPESQNIEIQFNDNTSSFKVKIYYAENFSRLRAAVLSEGEEGFIRSLSRCVTWAASGGKSGSKFSKTKDDRFILKEMTRLEMQLFVNFAPQYFNYINCVSSGMPTLLGKILGVYRVIIKSEKTNYTMKMLVMEHLFYNRVIKHKFDLKGSVRNRLISTSSDHSETVLLDENLIKMTCDNPLYILSHSKTVLMQAIQNDTEFLASQSVMDYSLLVGLDETKNELVLGIIDYIRGYTWDKKIETMVKRIGQNKEPTIIPADEYRERFIAAMHRYFLPVPDRWTGLGRGVDLLDNEIRQVR
ncbi:1-phosphatidylinositol 3-phosphate 5-kinase isoform X2 [Cimex lectularius]|nr:1-phosphatidylinositol 3-phosphate 5-kinase isoform X2 [Cimex lectularius]XP_024081527.1 1-phosphatidylinositol 3-phosphate 5-kinase isoform X2 [Cimex lectularius]